MKKYLLLLSVLILAQFVSAQNYLINNYNGQTVTTCSGKAYDSGGAGGGYGPNENYSMTICSNNVTNTHIKLYFWNFDVHATDTLFIYDGNSTAAPLIGKYNNNNSLMLFPVYSTLNNPGGCLTIQFKSNPASQGGGFEGEISCSPVCQAVISGLDSINMIPMPHDSNYVDVCWPDSIKFVGKGIYPQNGIVYTQSDATSTFNWNFGDGVFATGPVVWHKYNMVRGYDIQLTVTDVNGCVSMNALGERVRISTDPLGHVNPLPDICSGTPLDINVGYSSISTVNVTLPSFYQSSSLAYDSATFIPDGGAMGGACYNTYVTFNVFNPGQLVTQASDVVSVCVNMEHSFQGDLEMKLICPNGQSSTVKEYVMSGGAFIGVPKGGANHPNYDCGGTFSCQPCTTPCQLDPLQNQAGEGWNYCWTSMSPQFGTMQSYGGGAQIDSGSYTPFQPFSNLIGCPLNGTWNFQVCDYWGIDNGWVFSWELNLDPSILPVNWGYTVPIDTVIWSGPWISSVGHNIMTLFPDTGGVFNYNVQIIDEFGCTYDTNVNINVVTTPVLNLGPDTSMCAGNTITITPPNYPFGTYYWLPFGDTSQVLNATESASYKLIVMTGNGNIQCMGTDTININFFPTPLISFVPDDYGGCQPVIVSFDNATKPSTATFLWDFGDGTTSTDASPIHEYITPGIYNVTLTATTGEGCVESYSVNSLIKVFAQPVAGFTADPATTTIQNANITFTNTTTNGVNYLWTFGDNTEGSHDVNPTHIYTDKGVYEVWMWVETPEGCKDSLSVKIEVIDDILTIPNVITPNGDGRNDYFEVKNLDSYLSNELLVYNRWGKKVYEKANYQNDWDGSNADDGTYYFVLRCKGLIKDNEITGTITIIR